MSNLTTKRVALAEATLEQLLTFATINLALDVPEKTAKSKGALLALVQSAFHGDTINLIEAPAPADKVLGGRPARTRIRPGTEHLPPEPEDPSDVKEGAAYQVTEVCIQIEVQEKPGGKEAVYAAVNGRGIWIERGKPQWVRKEYVEVLEHAVRWEYPENLQLDSQNLGGLDEATRREVKAYPFQFV